MTSISSPKRHILITAALPYANGSIHLGHLLEYVQADIWNRFQKAMGHDSYFICADDAHGTGVMISAEKSGQTPEVFIQSISEAHQNDLAKFDIEFDHYSSTHSPTNQQLVQDFFHELQIANLISIRTIEQFYDQEKGIFLSDRFVKGTCPHCKTADQYGDHCEKCGQAYSAMDLIDPHSVYTNNIPVVQKSDHYFFKLDKIREPILNFIQSHIHQPEVRHKLLEWFEGSLLDWDISRDAPYFGFPIPTEESKYFYVWLDAPVAYWASFMELCAQEKLDSSPFFQSGGQGEIYHFIGKDIIYFHSIFWIALLIGTNRPLPKGIFAHGFMTLEGKKMSKSRGNFITAADFAQTISDPTLLRYFIADRLSDKIEDIDLNLTEVQNLINADVIGKLVNLASRSGKLITRLDGRLATTFDSNLLDPIMQAQPALAELYEKRQYRKLIREIMNLCEMSNTYVNDKAPWKLLKDEAALEEARMICTTALNAFYYLITYLMPILPSLYQKAMTYLQEPTSTKDAWTRLHPLIDQDLPEFTPLAQRFDDSQIEALRSFLKISTD